MKTLNVILGKSFSGKTETKLELLNESTFENFKTTTTRPRRKNETNADYHFINKQQFQSIEDEQKIALRTYRVANHDHWSYFINAKDLIKFANQKNTKQGLLIIDAIGYQELIQFIKSNQQLNDKLKIQGWYLNVSIKERMRRYLNGNRTHENQKETLRRFYDDEFNADFDKLITDPELKGNTITIKITTQNPNEIKNIIISIIKVKTHK